MKHILKFLLVVATLSIIVFCVSFFTARDDIDFMTRVGYSFVMGGVGGIISIFSFSNEGTGSNKGVTNKKSRVATRQKTIYIYRGAFEKALAYRVDGDKIYQGTSARFSYILKNGKIYDGLSNRVLYRIEGNKIYRGYDRIAAYRIDGDRIYAGDFERRVCYRIQR